MSLETLTADPELQPETGFEEIGSAAPGDGEIATLAYRYWQERGCPEGGSDEDWYRAVRELTNGSRG